jgi:hypothetical protein
VYSAFVPTFLPAGDCITANSWPHELMTELISVQSSPVIFCWLSSAQYSLISNPVGTHDLIYVRSTELIRSQSQSCVTTDGQSVSLSSCPAHIWCPRPDSEPKSKSKLLSLSLMLRPTVSRPVSLGIKHPSGAYDQIFITVRQLRVC